VPVLASSYAFDASFSKKAVQNRPLIRQIQPIQFPGRLEAINTPTTGKEKKGKIITNLPTISASWEGAAIKVRMANTTATANIATVRPASDQASQVAVR